MVQAHMPDADVKVAQVEVSAVDGGIGHGTSCQHGPSPHA
jgi:hypothetical protein